MFNFIKEAMAPTTRSAQQQQQQPAVEAKNAKSMQDANFLIKDSNSNPVPMKGYKIADNERTHKYGIGANSLQMLKSKAKQKFPVSIPRIKVKIKKFLLQYPCQE